MAKRESAAGQSKRAMTESQKANLAKGRKARHDKAEAAKALNLPKAKERWAMLLDGTLTVKDLDDEELERCQMRNRNGQFGGRPRIIPSHLAAQFSQERMRRAKALMEVALPNAIKTLIDIAADPDVKEADRIKSANIILERVLGKAEQTVHVTGESIFERLTTDALLTDRDLSDLAGGTVNAEGDA